jgi:hypothetical protein
MVALAAAQSPEGPKGEKRSSGNNGPSIAIFASLAAFIGPIAGAIVTIRRRKTHNHAGSELEETPKG